MLLYTNNELVQIYRVFTQDFANTSVVFGQKRPDGAQMRISILSSFTRAVKSSVGSI